jgi:PAS domain S-box-containing protein
MNSQATVDHPKAKAIRKAPEPSRAQEELRESEHNYRTLLNAIDEGFCIIEVLFDSNQKPVDYVFLQTNPSFERQTGLLNAVGKRMRQLAPGHEEHWFETYGRIALTGQPARFQNRAEQLHRWYDVYAFRWGQPEQRQVAILFNDITQRKRSEEELERLVKERTAMLREAMAELEHMSYSMVHDMRAPLRAMQSFAGLLAGEYAEALPAEAREYARRIKQSASRLDQLVTGALNYNEVVRQDLPYGAVELAGLLRGMVESYPNLHSSGADIHIEFKELLVLGHESALTQCFGNLLDNAVKFVPPGVRPKVRIWAQEVRNEHGDECRVAGVEGRGPGQSSSPVPRHSPPFARIWVEDNGIGIPKAAQERLFRLFQRLHREEEYAGTGTGLAIVRKALERMGGRVGLVSEPGKGSRFWVELPRP